VYQLRPSGRFTGSIQIGVVPADKLPVSQSITLADASNSLSCTSILISNLC
jgi:hypothetical protein